MLEGQRQQPLLLQVGLVDASEAAGDDRRAAEQPRRQRGVLAAAALAVVGVADDDPADAARLVVAGDRRDRLARPRPISTFMPLPASPVKALVAPMNMLSLNLSRWPAVAQPGPAGEMWSVVVLPLVLSRTGMSRKSLPSQAGHGCRSWSRWLSASTSARCRCRPLAAGGAM